MAKPTYLPEWALQDETLPATQQPNKYRPNQVARTRGYDRGQKPPVEEWNWQFNNIYEWVKWFNENALDKGNNLSEITDKAEALANLGIGRFATDAEALAKERDDVIVTPSHLQLIVSQYGRWENPLDGGTAYAALTINNNQAIGRWVYRAIPAIFNTLIAKFGTYYPRLVSLPASGNHYITAILENNLTGPGNKLERKITFLDIENINNMNALARDEWATLKGNYAVSSGGTPSTGWEMPVNNTKVANQESVIAPYGWKKYEDGLIEQWGFMDRAITGVTGTTGDVTFLRPFPSNCFNVQLSLSGPGASMYAHGDKRRLVWAVNSQSTTGFSWYCNTSYANLFWRALGN